MLALLAGTEVFVVVEPLSVAAIPFVGLLSAADFVEVSVTEL
jgi:hypothetical protein